MKTLQIACLGLAAAMTQTITNATVATDNRESLRQKYAQPVASWPPATLEPDTHYRPLGKLPKPPASSKALKTLGKALFFDPRLSKSGQIACASCHDPELGWGDGRSTSFGHDRQRGTRNAMTVLNSVYFEHSFWDGRASGIEQQALMPITNPIEMADSLDGVIAKLKTIGGYQPLFVAAFDSDTIDAGRLAKALAAFESTVVSRPSRFDNFLSGNYRSLSDREIEGLHLFRTKAGCINCHSGPLLSDGKFHNIGLSYTATPYQDFGRSEITADSDDKGKFRTPSLRDLAFTGPYMHNGLFPHLRGVLNLYNRGIAFGKKLKPGEPAQSELIKPLKLKRSEILALEAFLGTLSSRPQRVLPPELPQ
ncbi:MAG: cytochrome-c peroxidase [Pseudomonadales bacterium]